MVRQAAVAVLSGCCAAQGCDAVERVTLEIGQLSTAGVQASEATITLDVTARPDSSSPTIHARVARLQLPAAGGPYSDIEIGCTDLLVRQPEFACNQGSMAARGGPTGQFAMN